MRVNPLSKRLYTDEGVLIKQLHCPYRVSWDALVPTDETAVRRCQKCEKPITDTAGLTDHAVVAIVRADPSACLKVSLDQANLRVVHHDVR